MAREDGDRPGEANERRRSAGRGGAPPSVPRPSATRSESRRRGERRISERYGEETVARRVGSGHDRLSRREARRGPDGEDLAAEVQERVVDAPGPERGRRAIESESLRDAVEVEGAPRHRGGACGSSGRSGRRPAGRARPTRLRSVIGRPPTGAAEVVRVATSAPTAGEKAPPLSSAAQGLVDQLTERLRDERRLASAAPRWSSRELRLRPPERSRRLDLRDLPNAASASARLRPVRSGGKPDFEDRPHEPPGPDDFRLWKMTSLLRRAGRDGQQQGNEAQWSQCDRLDTI